MWASPPSESDGRTDGLTVKRAKFLRQTPSRSLHICRSCTQPSLAPRSPLRNVARNSLTGASSVVGRSGKGGFIEWGRRGRRRWWSWNVWSEAGRRRRRREIEEESVDRPRKEGIIERRAMARRRHICFVIDQTKGKRLRFRTITRPPLNDKATTEIGALFTGESAPPMTMRKEGDLSCSMRIRAETARGRF